MRRAIFRCRNKACKHVWAFDYPNKTSWGYTRSGERFSKSPADDLQAGCPKCGHKAPKYAVVKGRYNPDHRCDPRCENAVGPSCDCSCGGKNHGRGYLVGQ